MTHLPSSSMPAPSTNGGGDEVSSIARATTVSLPDTRSAKITYPTGQTFKRGHLSL